MALVITPEKKAEDQKSPQLYSIPSYIYNGGSKQSMANQDTVHNELSHSDSNTNQVAPPKQSFKQVASPKQSLKQIALPEQTIKHDFANHKSILDMSRETLRQDQFKSFLSNHNEAEPILLIGDANVEASPLVKLMARSLSANFNYPKQEGSFGIRGKVIAKIVLHPEGYFSDIQILQSSNNDNFDAAALYAINKAPRVVGVNHFLSTPKSFVIGFIFN